MWGLIVRGGRLISCCGTVSYETLMLNIVTETFIPSDSTKAFSLSVAKQSEKAAALIFILRGKRQVFVDANIILSKTLVYCPNNCDTNNIPNSLSHSEFYCCHCEHFKMLMVVLKIELVALLFCHLLTQHSNQQKLTAVVWHRPVQQKAGQLCAALYSQSLLQCSKVGAKLRLNLILEQGPSTCHLKFL